MPSEQPVPVEGSRYLADRIVEVSPTGALREVWNVWDHYTPDPSEDWSGGFYVPDPEVLDWSHVNAISYSAAEDAYFVSLPLLGNAQRLPDGNTLLVFSSAGEMNEVSPSGDVMWRLNLDLGAAFGFSERIDSLYPAE